MERHFTGLVSDLLHFIPCYNFVINNPLYSMNDLVLKAVVFAVPHRILELVLAHMAPLKPNQSSVPLRTPLVEIFKLCSLAIKTWDSQVLVQLCGLTLLLQAAVNAS